VGAFSFRRVWVYVGVAWIALGLSFPLHAKKTKRPSAKQSTTLQKPGRAKVKDEIQAKRSDLNDIKRRIGDLRQDVEANEAKQAEAVRDVAEAEREVSKATRALRQAIADRAEAERQLAELEAAQRETEKRIATGQSELANWLRRNYLYGTANGISAFLAARGPNQYARDAWYLGRIGQARLNLIEGLRADLQAKEQSAQQIDARRKNLIRLEDDRRKRQEKLEYALAVRRAALENITAALKTQRERIGTLQASEERLGKVIDTLARQAAEAEARIRAARLEREQAEKLAEKQQSQQPRPQQSVVLEHSLNPDRKPEPVVGRVRETASATPGGAHFAQLRGRLNFPVAGNLVGTFGSPRAGLGTAWRGVFIRAPNGTAVKAVSDGAVVFSDWLRGYGNLLIVDHGGGYLSIYGNNDALYKETGDTVHGGEAIASVGASGNEAESGLYFEIRHRGQAVDPMQWVRLK
jgi:septal ring factor EnvC (AmiA/AmiB activator)